MSYISSTDLLIKYPDITNRFNWTKRSLGFFVKNKILTGYYLRNKRVTMIRESSLLELMAFAIEILNQENLTDLF